MSVKLALIPNLMILTVLICMLFFSLQHVSKWRTKSYKLLSSSVAIAVLFPLYYSIRLGTMPFNTQIETHATIVMIALIGYALLFTVFGVQCYFAPEDQKALYAFGTALLIQMVLIFLPGPFPLIVLFFSSIAFSAYYYYRVSSVFPKSLYVLSFYSIAAFLAILHLVSEVSAFGMLSLTLLLACFFVLIYTVFGRVVYLIHSASYASVTDVLTGLINRTFFLKQAQGVQNKKTAIAFAVLNLDYVKQLEHAVGHNANDEILRLVGRILKEQVEGHGFAGRYGAEEFAITITQPEVNLEMFFESIRQEIEIESQSIYPITVTIGWRTLLEEDSQSTVHSLIEQANVAMHIAKAAGKNRIQEYEDWMEQPESTFSIIVEPLQKESEVGQPSINRLSGQKLAVYAGEKLAVEIPLQEEGAAADQSEKKIEGVWNLPEDVENEKAQAAEKNLYKDNINENDLMEDKNSFKEEQSLTNDQSGKNEVSSNIDASEGIKEPNLKSSDRIELQPMDVFSKLPERRNAIDPRQRGDASKKRVNPFDPATYPKE